MPSIFGIELPVLLAMVVSVIALISNSRKNKAEAAGDVAEAVSHLLGPTNKRLDELEAIIEKQLERETKMKSLVFSAVSELIEDLDKFRATVVQYIDGLKRRLYKLKSEIEKI